MRAGKRNVTLEDIRQNLNSPQPVANLKVESHLPSIRPKSSLRPSKIGEQLLQKSVVPSKLTSPNRIGPRVGAKPKSRMGIMKAHLSPKGNGELTESKGNIIFLNLHFGILMHLM